MARKDGVLVTGITGHQGGAVADSLLRHGIRVVGLTRHADKAAGWKARGAELVEGDLLDRKSLDAALLSVDKVYLVTTPFEAGMDAEILQGTTMIDAAVDAGIGHLVYSSVVAADRRTGIPHFETKARVEEHLHGSKVPFTILRPVFFMENFLENWILPGIHKGSVAMGVRADRRLQMVSVRDIGEFALAAFRTPDWYLKETIEIAGDSLVIPDALAAISKVTGREIRYEVIPDGWLEESVGADLAKMYRWFNEVGYDVDIHALEKRWEIPLTKFREFVLARRWSKGGVKAA